jgi:hypothetical protein
MYRVLALAECLVVFDVSSGDFPNLALSWRIVASSQTRPHVKCMAGVSLYTSLDTPGK